MRYIAHTYGYKYIYPLYGDKIFDVLTSYGYLIPEDRKLIGEIKANQMKNAIYDFFTDYYLKEHSAMNCNN